MGFPILRLPVVALKVLLDYMDNVELVTVSLLSRRAAWFLMACGKKKVSFYNLQEYEIRDLRISRKLELFLYEAARSGITPDWPINLSVSMHNTCFLLLENDKGFKIRVYVDNLKDFDKLFKIWELKYLKMGNLSVPYVIVRKDTFGLQLYTLWDNKANGIISILKFFNNDLDIPIDKLTVNGVGRNKEFSNNLRKITEYINSTGNLLGNIEIDAKKSLSETDFKYLLQNVAVSGSFNAYNQANKKFEFDGLIQAKSIFFRHGYWFKMEHLLASVDYEEIQIYGSKFSNDELREFMTLWKAGKYPKLKKVTLGVNQPKFWPALDGFARIRRLARRERYGISSEIYGFGSSSGSVSDQYDGTFRMSVYHGE